MFTVLRPLQHCPPAVQQLVQLVLLMLLKPCRGTLLQTRRGWLTLRRSSHRRLPPRRLERATCELALTCGAYLQLSPQVNSFQRPEMSLSVILLRLAPKVLPNFMPTWSVDMRFCWCENPRPRPQHLVLSTACCSCPAF